MEWCYNEEVAFLRSKILALLREAGDSYLSGEEMAKRLGVSRTAVWKHIQELRRDGYDIVSHSRSGYSLQSAPDTLRPEEIKNGLHTRRIGTEIRFYPTIDSTNLEAKRLAQQGARNQHALALAAGQLLHFGLLQLGDAGVAYNLFLYRGFAFFQSQQVADS